MNNAAVINAAVINPAGSARVKLRLTRRGRAVFTSLAAVPIVAAACVFALNGHGAAATTTSSGRHFDYVTVQSGQSLWQIAERVAPRADPRDVISNIVSLNQLGTLDIVPGQRIAIPAEY